MPPPARGCLSVAKAGVNGISAFVCFYCPRFFTNSEGVILNCFWKQVAK